MSGEGTGTEICEVDVQDWVRAATEARDQGWDWFEFLDATDDIGRSDTVVVVCQLRRRDMTALQLHTRVPRLAGVLPSLAGVFPGAAWAEREAGEAFDLSLEGDDRPLLLDERHGRGVLRKDQPLAARAGTEWPGATGAADGSEAEGGRARRRMTPPGVPDPAVWGDRDPEAAEPGPDEIAGAGRRRGRRRR